MGSGGQVRDLPPVLCLCQLWWLGLLPLPPMLAGLSDGAWPETPQPLAVITVLNEPSGCWGSPAMGSPTAPTHLALVMSLCHPLPSGDSLAAPDELSSLSKGDCLLSIKPQEPSEGLQLNFQQVRSWGASHSGERLHLQGTAQPAPSHEMCAVPPSCPQASALGREWD